MDGESPLDRRTRAHGLEPAHEMRELRQLLALPLGQSHPADAGDVGDRITAGQKFALGKPRIHDAIEPVDLVGVTRDRVSDLLGRVAAEMNRLTRHRTQPSHLPEQPLIDGDPGALILRIKFSGLAAEILQDGARLENRDRPCARSGGVHNRRHTVVRRDR